MIRELVVRGLVSAAFAAFVSLIPSELDKPNGRYSSGLNPTMVVDVLVLLALLWAFYIWRAPALAEAWGVHVAGIYWNVAVSVFVYYSVLPVLLPRLRKSIRPRSIAFLWLLPNVLYITGNPSLHLSSPVLTLFISRAVFLGAAGGLLTGFAGVLLYRIGTHLRFRRGLLKSARPETDPEVLALWLHIQKCVGFRPREAPRLLRVFSRREGLVRLADGERSRFPLLRSAALTTPVSVGGFRWSTRVLLPERDYTREELEWIFRHELTHVARMDGGTKFFLTFCAAVSWFNPLMWSAMERCAEDLELSCDETVLLFSEAGQRRAYAELLLREAGDSRGFTTCLSATARSLRYRLSQVTRPAQRSQGILAAWIASFLLFFTFGLLGLAWPAREGLDLTGNPREIVCFDGENAPMRDTVRCTKPQELAEYLNGLTLYHRSGREEYCREGQEVFLRYVLPGDRHVYLWLSDRRLWLSGSRNVRETCYFLRETPDWAYLESLWAPEGA